jgi:hypothetical protein
MNFESFREIQVDETEEFKNFSTEIDNLVEFFKRFSELIFYNGRIISFFTDSSIHYLNTSLLDSSSQTLRSIKLCCSIGSFSDANTLIRKFRDDLILYVYILSIIDTRTPFIEEDLKNLKIDNPEEFVDSFSTIRINSILTDEEKAVTAWFTNSVSDLPKSIRRKLEFENYMKIIKQNPKISHILEQYNLQNYWETLRKRLNDYVHNNGVRFSTHNSIRVNDKNLDVHLKNINTRTFYIASFFIVALLMVDSSLIASTDYIDHLDCNLEPPEDSQYFVANFIQHFIDSRITKLHPELKQYLIDNNNYAMKIE